MVNEPAKTSGVVWKYCGTVGVDEDEEPTDAAGARFSSDVAMPSPAMARPATTFLIMMPDLRDLQAGFYDASMVMPKHSSAGLRLRPSVGLLYLYCSIVVPMEQVVASDALGHPSELPTPWPHQPTVPRPVRSSHGRWLDRCFRRKRPNPSSAHPTHVWSAASMIQSAVYRDRLSADSTRAATPISVRFGGTRPGLLCSSIGRVTLWRHCEPDSRRSREGMV